MSPQFDWRLLPTAAMDWCDKHHRALFVLICDKELLFTTNVLHRIFSPCGGDVVHIARFRSMGDVHAWVNFYSPEDAMNAFYLLQCCQIYEGCC